MPIDFERIAQRFQQPFRLQLLPMIRSFLQIGAWLERRVAAARLLEQNTRDFPSVAFIDEALVLYVDRSQHGVLRLEPPRSAGRQLRDAGEAFLNGLGRIGTAITEELAIPRFLDSVQRALDVILASLDRFAAPRASMFDPTGHTASDVFGEAALAFRAATTSGPQLRAFAGQIGGAMDRLGLRPGAAAANLGAAGEGEAGAVAERAPSFAEKLDTYARYILGGVLFVVMLPRILEVAFRSGSFHVKLMILDVMASVEARVFGVRRTILESFFTGLPTLIERGARYLGAVGVVMGSNIGFAVRFGALYASSFVRTMAFFLGRISRFVTFAARTLIGTIEAILDEIADFDLMPVIIRKSGLPGWLVTSLTVPSFRIGDLVGPNAQRARGSILSLVSMAESIIGTVVGPFWRHWLPGIARKLDLIRAIAIGAFQRSRPVPPETAAFTLGGLSFPNLYDTFIAPGLPALRAELQRTRVRLETSVQSILGAGYELLTELADSFDTAADQAAFQGPTARYRALATRADALAASLTGPESDAVRARIAAQRPDLLAVAFERWLAGSGFQMVAVALPLYVEEMFRYLEERAASGEEATVRVTPTSPRILARRAQLGRVQMHSMVIHVEGRALDQGLATEIAQRFRAEIDRAYLAGRARLRDQGVEPPVAGRRAGAPPGRAGGSP